MPSMLNKRHQSHTVILPLICYLNKDMSAFKDIVEFEICFACMLAAAKSLPVIFFSFSLKVYVNIFMFWLNISLAILQHMHLCLTKRN